MSNQKKGHFMLLIEWFYFDSLTQIFCLDLFLEARAEILTKISLVFLGDLKTPKGHFEINWPLQQRIFWSKSTKKRVVRYYWYSVHSCCVVDFYRSGFGQWFMKSMISAIILMAVTIFELVNSVMLFFIESFQIFSLCLTMGLY